MVKGHVCQWCECVYVLVGSDRGVGGGMWWGECLVLKLCAFCVWL